MNNHDTLEEIVLDNENEQEIDENIYNEYKYFCSLGTVDAAPRPEYCERLKILGPALISLLKAQIQTTEVL